MTEERKKELIKIWAKRITTVGWCCCIEELIRTVAAEAREEGIEEMRGAAARRWPKVTFAMTRIAEGLKEKV